MDKRHNIFISHLGKDDDKVQALKERLKASGYDGHSYSVDSTKHKRRKTTYRSRNKKIFKNAKKWTGTLVYLIGKEHLLHGLPVNQYLHFQVG